MRWRWWLADAEPDRPSLRVKVHIRRTEHRPRIDEVGAESRGKTSHCPSPLTAAEGLIPAHTGKTHGSGRPSSARSLIPAHAGKTVRDEVRFPRVEAHPRSRGENDQTLASMPCVPGSSPLTRGKRPDAREYALRTRLIPAHAGKTSARCGSSPPTRAHPRSRGENICARPSSPPPSASSPLTRGKHDARLAGEILEGLIPAHAGKTVQFICALITIGAHPRSRGENGAVYLRSDHHRGSSPLTRGKRARSW